VAVGPVIRAPNLIMMITNNRLPLRIVINRPAVIIIVGLLKTMWKGLHLLPPLMPP
jgi:hypothetical protein